VLSIEASLLLTEGTKKVFLPSPRNSLEAHLSLLDKLNCGKFAITEPALPCVADILKARPLEILTIPSLSELLDLDTVPEYPFERSTYDHRTDPILVLHTSGSTGIPKPLVYTNEFWSRVMNQCKLASPPGHQNLSSYFMTGKFLMTLPGFHVSQMCF
jgi:acyl-CoA synthetase (AMP-forming)/AMP-acid ligase II